MDRLEDSADGQRHCDDRTFTDPGSAALPKIVTFAENEDGGGGRLISQPLRTSACTAQGADQARIRGQRPRSADQSTVRGLSVPHPWVASASQLLGSPSARRTPRKPCCEPALQLLTGPLLRPSSHPNWLSHCQSLEYSAPPCMWQMTGSCGHLVMCVLL